MSQAQANGHGAVAATSPAQRRAMLEELAETEMNTEVPQPVLDLLSKDFVLSKIRQEDREYLRLLAENIVIYAKEQYPPPGSELQGVRGAVLTGDPDYNVSALSQERRNSMRSFVLTAFVRIARSEGGWQQEKFSEQIQTRRVEDNREEEDAGGFWGSLFR